MKTSIIRSFVYVVLALTLSSTGYSQTSDTNRHEQAKKIVPIVQLLLLDDEQVLRNEQAKKIVPILQLLLLDDEQVLEEFFNAGADKTVTVGDAPFTQAATGGQGSGLISYDSLNAAVATVDSTGQVTILGAGETTITATKAADTNHKEVSDNYQLTVNKANQSGFNAGADKTVIVGDAPFTQAATGGQGNGVISYDSSNMAVATVNNNGQVTILGAGETTITATKAADANYKEISDSYTLNVEVSVSDDAPMAEAGAAISTYSNSIVELDGSASTDPNGVIVGYSWQQTAGKVVLLLNSHQSSPGFVAPQTSETSVLEFELKVTDNDGNTDKDVVKVMVNPSLEGGNTAPIVSLGVAPVRAHYETGSEISLLATVADAEDNVVSVKFYVDDVLKSTDSTLPYQYIWLGDIGTHTIKAVVTDDEGLTGEAILNELVVSDDDSDSGLTVTSKLNPENWQRLVLKVENLGDESIDIRDAVFIFNAPATDYNYSVRTLDADGNDYISNYFPFELNIGGGLVEHRVPLTFAGMENWRDTVLGSGEHYSVLVHGFAPELTEQIYNDIVKGSVSFYLKNAAPTDFAKATITVASAVSDTNSFPTDNVQIYVKNRITETTQIFPVAWGETITLVDLIAGVEYDIWADTLQSGGLRYTPNYSTTNPMKILTDKDVERLVNVSYIAEEIDQATVTLSFSGLPQGAEVDLMLTNQLSDESNKSFVNLQGDQIHPLLVDIGTYTLQVTDYRDPEDGGYYVADIPVELEISGNINLSIPFNAFAFGPVPGLPDYLSMGTITDGGLRLNGDLANARIDAIYRYAGPGGNGDRGQIIDPTFTRNAIAQARAVETDARKVMPIMVVYTAEASGGGYGENDIADYDNLVKHNINLIRIVKALQANKDADHPKPGGIILNADFLGALQQSGSLDIPVLWKNGKWNGPIDSDPVARERDIEVSRSLREAINYVVKNDGSQRVQVPQFDETLFGYLQMQNYIIRAYGPDVIFGWQQNLWSIGSADWVHTQRAGEDQLKRQVSDKVTSFVKRLGVYDGLWRPDFFAFDKYERDGFGPDARQNYAYNHNDWSNYLDYVKHIGQDLEIPTVIWQTPGGHMPIKDENIVQYDITAHSASAAPYLFGDARITSIDDLHNDLQNITLSESSARVSAIYHGRATAGEYLRESAYDWSQSQLQRVVDSGIVSILWGGGSTTSVVSLGNSTGHDDGWLLNKVNNYAEEGRLPLAGGILNSQPIVSSGSDQEVTSSETVNLFGSAVDTDGTISSVLWSSNSSQISFSSQNTSNTSFIAPLVDVDTDFVVTFRATDNQEGTASDSVTITVKPAPRVTQSLISTSSISVNGEESTSNTLTVSGGSGTGLILAVSSNPSAVSVNVLDNEISVGLLQPGTANITVVKLGDVQYLDSNSIIIPVAVSETTKLEQALISANNASYSGEVGQSATVVIAGGSGSGTLMAISDDTNIVIPNIVGNSVELNYHRVGNASVTIKKLGDLDYQNSNEVAVSVSVTPGTNPSADKFTVTPIVETGKVTLEFVNTSDEDINIRNGTFIVRSPVDVSNADLSPVNGSISYPSKELLSELDGDDYLISVKILLEDESYIDSTMEPGSKVQLIFYVSTDGITASDFSLVDVLLADAAVMGERAPGLSVLNDPVNLQVPGWGSCLAMGTVTQNDRSIDSELAAAKVGAIFKYEGDGFGDRGRIVEPDVTRVTIDQARAVENLRGDGMNVMPVMVVYTAEASSGGVGEEDIKVGDNLTKHFVNLITVGLEMQSRKDALHSNPGSIILNPDLFGEWLLNSYRIPNEFEAEYGKPGEYTTIQIRQAMQAAMTYLQDNGVANAISIPTAITDDILGFVQAHNFLIRSFAPDVTFGWQQNLWPMTGSANWVHQRYAGNQHLWDAVSHEAVEFLAQIGAYSGNWMPDFLVFDKYEFDGFGGGKGAYAYNNLDWQNYLLFVKQVTDAIQIPAMLWQIPGGHMPSDNDPAINFDVITHAASGGPFFMGDKAIGHDQSNIADEVLEITLDSSVYGVNTVGDYLAEDSTYDWGKSQLRSAAFSNVFAILWGGGNTTAIVQTGGSGDDDDWLKRRVVDYYDSGCTVLHSATTTSDGTESSGISNNPLLDNAITGEIQEVKFNSQALLTQLGEESSIYRWTDFIQAVKQMHQQGVGEFKLWLGGDDAEDNDALRARYGLVNLAAFLAQSMQETIQYNACDENNWSDANVVAAHPEFGSTAYPMTAACGQLGQDYGSYEDGSPIACPRDPKMEVSAATTATWYGAPGPLFAAPDSALEYHGLLKNGKAGRWDYLTTCSVFPSPAIAPGFEVEDKQTYLRDECELYKGQQAGAYVWDGSSDSRKLNGELVDSVEDCGWWGRGVIQTTGRGNFGRLNHYLGRTHLDKTDDSLMAMYPAPDKPLYGGLDLCSNPQLICTSTEHKELKWVAGLFYWMSSVQEYSDTSGAYGGWNYFQELEKFVDDGMTGNGFIDAVSGIVNRGCPAQTCPSGAVHAAESRRTNFYKVLEIMGIQAIQ